MAEKRERRINWLYDSKKQLLTFPKDVLTQVGYALSEAQMGRKADYSKPMTGLGAGSSRSWLTTMVTPIGPSMP